MKAAWALAFAIVLVLIGAGVLQWLGRPPQGEPIKLIPPPTPAPLVIHVAGAVNRPGVYELPIGARVRDAITAAGGFTPDADFQQLNLAEELADGRRILVPVIIVPVPGESRSGEVVLTPGFPVNINTATQAELEALPEIGPKTAENIINYRNVHGPFHSIDEIDNVDGIGPATLEKIKDLITIN